jgi:hypothetical protein
MHSTENQNVHGEIVGGSRGGGFASDQTAPGFVALVDDLHGVLLIFGLAREGEGVLGLTIRDLVDPKECEAKYGNR